MPKNQYTPLDNLPDENDLKKMVTTVPLKFLNNDLIC